MKNNFLFKIVNFLFKGKKQQEKAQTQAQSSAMSVARSKEPYVQTFKNSANGEFRPAKHPICTYAQQKRNAKKRKNINKHKKV